MSLDARIGLGCVDWVIGECVELFEVFVAYGDECGVAPCEGTDAHGGTGVGVELLGEDARIVGASGDPVEDF